MGTVFTINPVSQEIYDTLTSNNFPNYGTGVAEGPEADTTVLYFASTNQIKVAAYPFNSTRLGMAFYFETITQMKQWWNYSNIITRNINSVIQNYDGYFYILESTNMLLNKCYYEPYNSKEDAINALANYSPYHPIHYSTIGDCTITGPLDAPSGQDCVVTVNPAQGWIFRGASGVKIVDALNEPVPFIVNGNSFSFTMPQFADNETTGVYVTVTVVNENPYSPGGESGESDGGGDFELENSPIPLPDLPTLNIINTGFVKAYNPTLAELAAFQRWLWADNPFENVWRSVLGNPYDYIIGLKAMPVEPDTGTAQQVTLGNVTTPSTLTMKPVTGQYKRHDFGAVNFQEYSKSFLDYAPYTRVSLYLPYIGFVQIDADIINNKAVNIQYSIDMLSGAIMAFVIVGGKTLYAFSGSMGLDVPTTNQSYNNILSGIVGVVGGVAAMGAAAFTGGLAVPMGISGLANAAAGVISATKPTLEHGNGLSGVPGVMGNRYPYFIIKRPKQSVPDNIQQFTGFPSNILKSLSDVSGFTKVEFAHLENISASDAEKAEIMELLQEGVIF